MDNLNLNMKLTKHFSLYEMMKSRTAERIGIDNTPPDNVIPNLQVLCQKVLEPIRFNYGKPFRPNSAYRCLELNRKLRSKDTSQHIKAEAVDIEIAGVSNYDLAVWVRDNLLFDQLILEHYTLGVQNSGWVHVSRKIIEGDNRREILTIGRGLRQEGLVV